MTMQPMTLPEPSLRLVATGLAMGIIFAGSAGALTWTHPNTPDENTIALFRFNEGEGSTTVSECGTRTFNFSAFGGWAANPGWQETPSGFALRGLDGITADHYAATASSQSLDWSHPAITFSFWMRDTKSFAQENRLFYFGHAGWRNQQAEIGYRPGWSNPSRIRYAGYGVAAELVQWPQNVLRDGEWHHVAIVGVRDGETGLTTVKLYIDNVQRNFTIGGQPSPTWTFTPTNTSTITENWHFLRGCGAEIDEFLIQADELTDFSNGINAPQPPSGTFILVS